MKMTEEQIQAFEAKLGITNEIIEESPKEEPIKEEVKEEPPKKSSRKKSSKKEEVKEEPINETLVDKFVKIEDKRLGETKIEGFLKNIQVDLNNIEITEMDEMSQFKDVQAIFNNKSVYQVVCNQSAYVAFVEPLNMSDVNAITNSTLDNYQSKRKLFETVYKRINNTSIGKFDFNTFLSITSYFDLNTLLYGIYMQTFPGNTDFSIKCRHCKKTIDVSINNDSLISVKDDNIYDQMQRVLNDIKTPEEALNHSLVNKYERVMLPDSKTVMELQIPSLKDYLNFLSSIDTKKVKELEGLLDSLLFIRKIFVLNLKETERMGKAKFFEINKLTDKFNIIRSLSVSDMKVLAEALADRINKYNVEYRIKAFDCTNCKKDIGDVSIDIETLLFRQILQL